MHESDWLEAMARRRIELARSGESVCRIEWESDDPVALFAEFVGGEIGRSDLSLLIDCGDIAAGSGTNAGSEVAMDQSLAALNEAAGRMGVEARPQALPFSDDAFDLICCRLLPGSDMDCALVEIARALRVGGALLGIAAGETHRIEVQEIFGRGTQWPPVRPLRFAAADAISRAGLELGSFAEYFGSCYCPDMRAFALDLTAQPIIPNFDPDKDSALLREVERKLMCEQGIRGTEHMAVFAAWKMV